jgi:hypothetical protein
VQAHDDALWHDMFHLGLPVAEKVLRPALVYAFLVVGLRLAGKRELAQLNPFDLVVCSPLSNTVQNAIIGDDNSVTGGLLGASTLLAGQLSRRPLPLPARIPRPSRRGRLPTSSSTTASCATDRLEEELITRTELESAARKQGFESLDEVQRADPRARRIR